MGTSSQWALIAGLGLMAAAGGCQHAAAVGSDQPADGRALSAEEASFRLAYDELDGACIDEASEAARREGLDYRAMLKAAFSRDSAAIAAFLRLASADIFDGAASEGYSDNIEQLMSSVGDVTFARAMERLTRQERHKVAIQIAFSWPTLADESEVDEQWLETHELLAYTSEFHAMFPLTHHVLFGNIKYEQIPKRQPDPTQPPVRNEQEGKGEAALDLELKQACFAEVADGGAPRDAEYRSLYRGALLGSTTDLTGFLRLDARDRYDGAASQSHAVNLDLLLHAIGDMAFARGILPLTLDERRGIGSDLAYDMGLYEHDVSEDWLKTHELLAQDLGFAREFPLTRHVLFGDVACEGVPPRAAHVDGTPAKEASPPLVPPASTAAPPRTR